MLLARSFVALDLYMCEIWFWGRPNTSGVANLDRTLDPQSNWVANLLAELINSPCRNGILINFSLKSFLIKSRLPMAMITP